MEKSPVNVAHIASSVKKVRSVYQKSFSFKLMSRSFCKEIIVTKMTCNQKETLNANQLSAFCPSIKAS